MKNYEVIFGKKRRYRLFFLMLSIIAIAGYAYPKKNVFVNQEMQQAFTPKQVLQDLKNGNKRFYSNNPIQRDSLFGRSKKASRKGQYPKAVILACMDSRSVPELIFDQSIADIFTLRVAGNVVNTDILASMEYATKHAGSKLIVVMGHTQCGAIEAACKGGDIGGNLGSLIATMEPAVASLKKRRGGKKLNCNDALTKKIAMENVHNMVKRVVQESSIIRDLIVRKEIALVGALHDLKSGVVIFNVAKGLDL